MTSPEIAAEIPQEAIEACPFCDYEGPSELLVELVIDGCAVLILEPFNPVTEGHLLAVPRSHAEDWLDAPWLAGMTMRAAAEYARATGMGDCNLITSKGAAATQTVKHLHLHIVPRREEDGLALPWSPSIRSQVIGELRERLEDRILHELDMRAELDEETAERVGGIVLDVLAALDAAQRGEGNG